MKILAAPIAPGAHRARSRTLAVPAHLKRSTEQRFPLIPTDEIVTTIRVVFVSRRNSLRSILAEACLAHLNARRFTGVSCGQPKFVTKTIHPAALGALTSAGIALPRTQPRSWGELARAGVRRADFVITLDESTLEAQPMWPGQPYSALWAFEDAAALDDPEQTAHAAVQMLYSLRRRLELLINLPLKGASPAAIRSDILDLGHMR
jgi:arsenate reductase (thioredoxin)